MNDKTKGGKHIWQRVFDSVLNAVRVTGAVTGTFTPSGLNIALKTTTMLVTDTAVKVPATSLTSRNFMSIYNKGTTTLYLGDADTVEAHDDVGVLGGTEVGAGESYNLDIAPGIQLWGIAEAGQSIKVKLTEVA